MHRSEKNKLKLIDGAKRGKLRATGEKTNRRAKVGGSGAVRKAKRIFAQARLFFLNVTAIGAARRRGWRGLAAQRGKIRGAGKVKHKDGTETAFVIDGGTAAKN